MKKTKKLSALLLILVMLVNLLPSAVAGTVAEASATEAVRYVSATGDDSANDGTTAEAPYKTLKAAITALNSVDATDKIVKIVGNYTWNRDDTVAHSKMITLAGNEGTEVLSLSGQNVWHQSGALKIENLVLNYTVSEGGIYSFGNEMVIGENVTVAYNGDTTASLSSFYPRLGAGAISSHTCSQSSPHKLTLNSGRFSDVFLGDTAFTGGTTHTTPGIEFTMNPGATVLNLKVGGNGANACNAYTGNVNLVLNGGTYANEYGSVQLAGTDTSKLNFNGNAVQLIINNGCEPTINPNFTAENIAACGNGVYYRLNCAAAVDGSILETTGTAGTYKVNGDMTATATDANGDTYVSVSGVLTVPAAGEYTVTWTSDDVSVYLSDDGVEGAAGTKADPFQTLAEAITALNEVENDNKTIKIVGSYTWLRGTAVGHSDNITITGSSSDAMVNVTGNTWNATGPITFQNVILNYVGQGNGFFAFGNELTIGDSVTMYYQGAAMSSLGTAQNVLGSGGLYGNRNGNATTPQTLTVNGGRFYTTYLGENQPDGATYDVPGVDFEMNGGEITTLKIGGDGSGTNNYTDDVNLVFNGGTIGSGVLFTTDSAGALKAAFNGNAVQIICNNGLTPNFNDNVSSANVTTAGGSLWKLACDEQEGSSLALTDTAGTYQVQGNMIAVATDSNNASLVYTSNDGVLTVPAGEYKVSWLDLSTVYVDADYGSDDNAGTEDEPFATMAKAVEVADGLAFDQKNVKIMGTYTWAANGSDYTAHTNMITVSGYDDTAKLDITGNRFVQGGPMTYESIILNYTGSSQGIYALGNEVVIGSGVTVTSNDTSANLSTFYPILGSGTHYGVAVGAKAGVQKLTMNGGRFYRVYMGDNYLSSGTSYVAGVDFTMNTGATATQIVIGGDGAGTHTYGGDVNLTINGGNIVNAITITKSDATKVDFGGNAVQIIANNGLTPPVAASLSQANVNARNGHLYQMNCAAVAGSTLAVTETAGVYTVAGDKIAIAVNQADASKTYLSEDGTLTVEAEGVYDVSFVAEGDYINAGTKIVVYNDCTIDLSAEDALDLAGKLFIGWADADGNGTTETSFTAGTVLTATYLDYTEDEFSTNGSSIYKVANTTTNTESIRLTAKISLSLLSTLNKYGTTSYGMVHIPYDTLGKEDLTLETSGAVSSNGANNAIANDGTTLYFATMMENIALAECREAYTYKAYIQFTDMNGNSRTEYTDYANGSVALTAEKLLAQISDMPATDNTYLSEIVQDAKTTAKNELLTWSTEAVTSHPNSSKTFDATKIAEVYSGFYRYTEGDVQGLIVREIDIDGVNTSNTETVEVVQVSDMHLNYINDKDRKENNPVIMDPTGGTYANRSWLKDGASWDNSVRAMNYAGRFDQVMVTGDAADYLSWGCLDLTRRATWELYPETMIALGNHEPVRKMQGTINDTTSLDSRYQILQDNWAHDIYYSSKVIKDKVMVIQMDNSQTYFQDSQVAKLTADLATAVEKQYTVLIFMHAAIDTKDGLETATSFYENDGATWDLNGKYKLVGRGAASGSATQQIVDLIASRGDVVRGVFTGHMHSDYYLPITATTSTGEACTIPQYVITAAAYENGHVLKINVK